MSEDRFDKFNKSGKKESEKKSKKVLLSMTERDYERLQHFQKLLNKNTLTSTIEYFIEQGIEKTRDDFDRVREK